MKDITILIKTFKRPEVAKRLINSIRDRYPDIKIMVAHDDDMDYSFDTCEMMVLPFDTGVSYGRNRLVDACKTKYCMILDDDCLFTSMTNLQTLLDELKDLDIIQPVVREKDVGFQKSKYRGIIEVKDGVMMMSDGTRDGLYDFVLNIFIAKTDKLRECRWNEELKLGEHAAFFRDHKGKLRIGYTEKVEIIHDHQAPEDYQKYRARAIEFVKQDLINNNLTKRIDVWGHETIV